MSSAPPVVIVGASVAGVRVAKALRRLDSTRPVILLDREEHLPYDKPALSKQVLVTGDPPPALATAQELRDLDVDHHGGTTARGLDTGSKVLRVFEPSRGREVEIPYGDLVLATGCSPIRLPSLDGTAEGRPRPSVHYVRTLADAERLRPALAPGRRVVVVGAGFIGTEVAASAQALGCTTTIVEGSTHMAARALAPEPAEHLRDVHRRHGTDVLLTTTVASLSDHGDALHVSLTDGRELEADVVVIGVGTRPEVAWLEGSGLCLGDADLGPTEEYPERAIYCDPFLRARGVEDVWAVGDAARWPHPHPEEQRAGGTRYEHWTSAQEQATSVATAIVRGVGEPVAPIPYVWSDQFDTHLQHVGWRSDDVRRRDLANGGVLYEFHKDGDVVGATGFNAQAAVMDIRKALTPQRDR